MRNIFFIGFFAVVFSLAGVAVAQGPHAGTLTVHQLTPDIYWVEGGVGNCGVIIGEKGVVVIDTTVSREGGAALLDNIAEITPKPVTTVILTHGDMDHIGGLAAFPAGITIIAQENTRKSMKANVAAGGGKVSADHLPNRIVSTHREVAEIEGVRIELLHWAPAHTNGDIVIYLPEEKIVFTGDIYCMDQKPVALIHREQEGNSAGWIESSEGVISLDAERFVVGHGDVQTREILRQKTGEVEAERARIEELVAQGLPLEKIQEMVGDPSPGGKSRFTPFSEVVYLELTEKQP